MLPVKILGNSGNTVYTDLDETAHIDPETHSVVCYVTYGVTPKAEIREHIAHQDFMICKYHAGDGHNAAFLYPMTCVINYSHPGEELVEFINTYINGNVTSITYNVATDTWSEGNK